jgi:hypothetical protein
MTLNVKALNPYMFTRTYIAHIIQQRLDISKNSKLKQHIPPPKPIIQSDDEQYYIILQKDSLFWCYYIIKNGLFSYESNGMDRCKETSIKIKMVETLKQSNGILQLTKCNHVQLEDDLVNKDRISLQTFFYICKLNQINCVILKNGCLYILVNNPTRPYELIVYNTHTHKYMLSIHESNAKHLLITQYKTKYYIIPDINKPLKSISSYKINMLRNICNKLNICIIDVNGKPLVKRILYGKLKSMLLN